MTTIAAIHTSSIWYIASDGRITGDHIVQEDAVKLVKHEDYIIGMSWLSALSQVVEMYHIRMNLNSESDVYSLYHDIIALLGRYWYNKKLKNFDMILLTRFWLYLFDWTNNTFVRKNIFASIWSGANFAYGYLHAHEDTLGLGEWDMPREGLIRTLEECIGFVSRIDPYTNTQITTYTL